MYIDNHVGSLQILTNRMCRLFEHRPLGITWKDAVHIQVEIRNATLNRINTQRIQSREYFHLTVKHIQILLQYPVQFVAYVLSFQFVTVRTRNDTHPLLAYATLYNILLDKKLFVYRQCCFYYCIYHISFISFTITFTSICCWAQPVNTPLFTAQSAASLP